MSTYEEIATKKSTKMWMKMITTKWDKRKLKRIMRLVREGK